MKIKKKGSGKFKSDADKKILNFPIDESHFLSVPDLDDGYNEKSIRAFELAIKEIIHTGEPVWTCCIPDDMEEEEFSDFLDSFCRMGLLGIGSIRTLRMHTIKIIEHLEGDGDHMSVTFSPDFVDMACEYGCDEMPEHGAAFFRYFTHEIVRDYVERCEYFGL